MSITANTNRPNLRDSLRKIIGGVAKHYGKTSTLVLRGVSYTPAELTALFQSVADALDAADVFKASWHERVVTAKDKSVATRPVLRALRAFVTSQLSDDAEALADFGYAPPKKSTVTVDTKAGAKAKSAATRKALGPTGKKQRKAKAKAAVSVADASHPK